MSYYEISIQIKPVVYTLRVSGDDCGLAHVTMTHYNCDTNERMGYIDRGGIPELDLLPRVVAWVLSAQSGTAPDTADFK
jgi:hypothetical protein